MEDPEDTPADRPKEFRAWYCAGYLVATMEVVVFLLCLDCCGVEALMGAGMEDLLPWFVMRGRDGV